MGMVYVSFGGGGLLSKPASFLAQFRAMKINPIKKNLAQLNKIVPI